MYNKTLESIKESYSSATGNIKKRIVVCAGTGCIANGSRGVYEELVKAMNELGVESVVEISMEECNDGKVHLSESGCQGFCQVGPLVTILPDDILYVHVKKESARDIIEKTILNNEIVEELLYTNPVDKKHYKGHHEIPFYKLQTRNVIAQCGVIDPGDLSEYIAKDGYKSARDVIMNLTEEETCQYILDSGLRGRGGGGFHTGRKWMFAQKKQADKKYIICNGDEGDPGAFMDRSLLEGNPHSVLEGMMIAARAIGADEGYIYVRVEYPLAVERVRRAIKDAEANGILGDNVFGTDFNFKINVMEGAGAFVCGEETALIASIEGQRGMPKPKPPFPADRGLFGKPTIINNVETLSTIPLIFLQGNEAYTKVGTESSPGTKTFALTGHVANTGLIEVPFGSTVRDIVFNIGGGVIDNDGNVDNTQFKAVQIGGPSGGCLTEEHLDVPLDFDSLTSIGAMVGSGGLVVMNKSTCIVQIARFFMNFTQNESCGKCVPCREGTSQMLRLLDDIIEGNGTLETLDLLEKTARTVKNASLCGLGKSAPSPVLSTLKYFRDEYEKHVVKGYCPTGQCKALTVFSIDPELCRGCTLCKRACPVDAISGDVRQPHTIDPDKCIKCGACVATCKFNAINGGA